MSVQAATRTVPQQLRAVQVTPENSAAIHALFAAITPKYSTNTQNDAAFADQGGTRITIRRAEYPDQFAYAGDWILVYDADFNPSTYEWTVSDSTTVEVWGVSAGLPGTADDFAATFTLGRSR